jgi:hypothetical protein
MPLVKVSRYNISKPDGSLEVRDGKLIPLGIELPLAPIVMSLFRAEAADDWFPVEPSLSKRPTDERGYITVPPSEVHAYLKAFAAINSGGYSSVGADPDPFAPDYKPEAWDNK